jgi:hypothetical protein
MRFWRMVLFLVVAAGAVCLGWEFVQTGTVRGPGEMVRSVGSSLQGLVLGK